MADNPDCPSVSMDCSLTDRLHTAIACIFSILQLVSQEPHHAGCIWV
jgi:hypothetical protein